MGDRKRPGVVEEERDKASEPNGCGEARANSLGERPRRRLLDLAKAMNGEIEA